MEIDKIIPNSETVEKTLKEYVYLSVNDTSELLGITSKTVYNYLKNGKLKGEIWNTRRIITTKSIKELLTERGIIK